MSIDIFEHKTIYPLAKYGFVGDFWGLNISTLIYSWIALIFILGLGFFIRFISKSDKKLYFLIPTKMFLEFFEQNIESNLGKFNKSVFEFVSSIFLFVLACNIIGIIPFIEEPAADINFSLAIGVSCFLFVQWQGLLTKGFGYFKKFFAPVFFLFPLNVIGQTSKIASLSFRLFGNVLGGAIVLSLLKFAISIIGSWYFGFVCLSMLFIFVDQRLHLSIRGRGWLFLYRLASVGFYFIPAVQFFFGVFEGVVQAFVVATLTSMYVANEVSQDGGH